MSKADELLKMSPREFVQFSKGHNISTFSFIYDSQAGQLKSSHPELAPIADYIQGHQPDFQEHEGLFFMVEEENDILLGVFVHRTTRGQAAGGVRNWLYATMEDYLTDGIRLSRAMTQKIALAGLWWGGGKGVIAHNPEKDKNDLMLRTTVYRHFGRLCSQIQGCYVAAEDVGTNVVDMSNIFSQTRFTTCIPDILGGSGNPSILTAKGVVCGMDAALEFMQETWEGKTIAVQGMGNVGGALIDFLFEKSPEKVIATDIDANLVMTLKAQFAGRNLEARAVDRGDNSIIASDCDILSLNATGAGLSPKTIPDIKAKIICGGANNQLEDAERDDALLMEKGILYVPDFLTNRMGITNCANEQYGYVNNDDFIERHLTKEWEHSIHLTTLEVLRKSKETGDPPGKIAMEMADELSQVEHPIFGHRGKQIIQSLVENRWHE